tara:strand:- start:133 stop:1338 length:1206 start_codon:yes stop_codon:yes gene_type:complete
MKIEIKVPNLGEAEDTEIIEISSAAGDQIKKNDPLIVLESEKAAMEVPSDYEGKLLEIRVKEGEKVKEGMVFAVIEVSESEQVNKEEKYEDPKNKSEHKPTQQSEPKQREKITLNAGVNCGPAVRKISRELGIDLKRILGTGRDGLITKDDLKKHIATLSEGGQSVAYPKLDDLAEFGPYELHNQSKIRMAGANNLSKAWNSIPHVTHFEEADITKLEKQRKELNTLGNVKITPLAFIIKAVAIALLEHKIINSSLVDKGKVMIRNYINIGVAIDTKDGLIVPVIKNANELTLGEIAKTINALAVKANEKKLFKNDLEGATFTVSSLGQIGGTNFTPIINPPEVGILGVSRSKKITKFDGNQLNNETILPISLSYDHRVVNGADAGKFMQTLKEVLEYKNV